ncbi:unnamed protein product [Ixodes pacificus]
MKGAVSELSERFVSRARSFWKHPSRDVRLVDPSRCPLHLAWWWKYRYQEEVDLPPTSSRLKDVDGLGTSVDHYSSSAVESPRKVSEKDAAPRF